MAYTTLLVRKNEHIGIITLNRPENLNTFTTVMAQEINRVLHDLEQDAEIRVIIIQGKGKAFCAGVDVNEMNGKNMVERLNWVNLMGQLSLTIASMGKPVIASVQDLAIANGTGIVLAADLAIAAEGARFGTTAVNLGLFCMGPAVALSRHVGKKKALEMLLTGDIIDAEQAKQLGLINKVVPREELETETLQLAQKIAAQSPLAVQMGKKSFYKMCDLEYAKAYELVNHHFAILCSTEDAQEGVNAFLEKRTPQWKMR
ncbi:putative enoyl-CoA hydratase echA8 [Sporotomaculum syntrophicum]|uniref:Enoyl-CoA hydratase domain-containing protein 3, mitochondrial n=1 Tax=Sporotomaculum syntrophicum TaxID=182264 RepID=A0A9D2WQQ7_9FIRM|nr:enoyl-CoA hydratase-related protein [Sporotomaculum syntrophicum]KAF1085186.1 putative enoyl-CoA hydratase echA8 [Sporotomaculum syntrophicum]